MSKDDRSKKEQVIYDRKRDKGRDRSRPVRPVTGLYKTNEVAGMQKVASTSRFGVKVTASEEEVDGHYFRPDRGGHQSYKQRHVTIQPRTEGSLSPFYDASRAASRHIRRHSGKKTD